MGMRMRKMSNMNNRVGEDKLSKMVRLLAKYELELGMVEGWRGLGKR